MALYKTIGKEELEAAVLQTFRKLKGPIGEDRYHMLHQVLDFGGNGLGFEYRLAHWSDVDEMFNSRFGAAPYSKDLHKIIEELVKKGFLRRIPKNPIKLIYCRE